MERLAYDYQASARSNWPTRIQSGATERIPIMKAKEGVPRSWVTDSLLTVGAVLVAAGGVVHLREWLEIYRHVPAAAEGSVVVRVGFPINTAASLLVATALGVCAWRRSRFTPQVVVTAVLLQVGSLAALIASRTGSFLGWSEPSWTAGAKQAGAIEIGAVISLAAVAVIAVLRRRNTAHRGTLPLEVRSSAWRRHLAPGASSYRTLPLPSRSTDRGQ